jgi:DNA-directed RNA polymerase subunit H (RpoH/RPB5)
MDTTILIDIMRARKYELELIEENTVLFRKDEKEEKMEKEEKRDENEEKETIDEKTEKEREKEKERENANKLIVFFPVECKVNIDTIKEILYKMEQVKIKNCIIIYKESITSSAKKALDVLDMDIETFHIDRLKYNILHHTLVPKHERVENKHEKKELVKKYGSQLPMLLRSDAVSRFYNYKKGDLIKITRTNNTVCYRIVV